MDIEYTVLILGATSLGLLLLAWVIEFWITISVNPQPTARDIQAINSARLKMLWQCNRASVIGSGVFALATLLLLTIN